MKLVSLEKNCKCRIIAISSDGDLKKKLLSLGVLEGDTIEIIGKALLGSPYAIKHGVANFFALRKSCARKIEVEKLS